jgi:hypothetical protein
MSNAKMLRRKKLDLYGQLTVVGGVLLTSLVMMEEDILYAGYFLLGIWQIISSVVTRLKGKQGWWHSQRMTYERVLVALVLLGIVSFSISIIWVYYMVGLLFAGVMMGAWYLLITWREMKVMLFRNAMQFR